MDLKIIDKNEQPMLSRIEITGKLEFQGATPSTADVKKQLSSELKVGEDLIVVKNIATHFGSETADLTAYAYLNKEDMGKIEPKPKEKKAKPGAKPAEGAKEAPKEAPKEEKKEEAKEPKKEEAPKEEKKE
jgi:ribosomal protein S24E